MTDVRDRIRHVAEAKDALSKSLGLLAIAPVTDDATLAQAMFFAALACLRLADADAGERGRALLASALDAEKARRSGEGRGTTSSPAR